MHFSLFWYANSTKRCSTTLKKICEVKEALINLDVIATLGVFVFHNAWNATWLQNPSWWMKDIVWKSKAPTSYCFLFWRGPWKKLGTLDKVRPVLDDIAIKCKLCGSHPGTVEHLLFRFNFSANVQSASIRFTLQFWRGANLWKLL